jgi:mannose/fructose/N-acetylgalactosamine-specific phosphotransferase system component IID
MYLIPIAWLYVTLMMAVAEATNTNGTVLGALVTFVLYGLLPIGLLLYFMGTPARKRARLAAEAQEDRARAQAAADEAAISDQPNTSSEPTADPVAPVRKEL